MKVTLNTPKQSKPAVEHVFPKLMVYSGHKKVDGDDNLVVLFTERECGIRMSAFHRGFTGLHEVWLPITDKGWSKFEGSLTLKN